MNARILPLFVSLSVVCAATAQVYEKVFSLTNARAEDIANATNKGATPSASLVQGSDGNFYGTTVSGGANDVGTIFKMTQTGMLTTLVEFSRNGPSNKGASPGAALVRGIDGNLYGMTKFGGASEAGTMFNMTPTGLLTTLVQFTNNGPSNKGFDPAAALIRGNDGDFYGTTTLGGANNAGTVFKVTPGWGVDDLGRVHRQRSRKQRKLS